MLIQLPAAFVAAAAGVLLFYVQHQFEDVYWETGDRWSYTEAALRGSSYLKLPQPLQFFTGNIGLHHVHHLSAKIPNYNLQAAHDENPVFHDVPVLTLRDCLRCTRLKLIDEGSGRLVTFAEARATMRAAPAASSAEPRPAAAAMSDARPRLLGINHVALEVDDIDAALEFYGAAVRVRAPRASPRDGVPGDGRPVHRARRARARRRPDEGRHFGLVVDDKDAARRGARGGRRRDPPRARPRLPRPLGQPRPGGRLPRHPVHEDPAVLAGMGVEIEKSESALAELREKGLGG